MVAERDCVLMGCVLTAPALAHSAFEITISPANPTGAKLEARNSRTTEISRSAAAGANRLEPDDDLPLGMTLLQVCKRIWDLLERKHPIRHRFQLTAIDQSP